MACFVGAWVVGGTIRNGYDPVNTAISELAASGTDHRQLMTGGFVMFGVGVSLYSWALRSALHSAAWVAALIAALATFGVAAAPLGAHDTLHVLAAATGYVALAAMPLLAAPAFRAAGEPRRAAASIACSLVTAALLAASLLDPAHGATQRGGLLVADAWIVVTSLTMWRQGELVRHAHDSTV